MPRAAAIAGGGCLVAKPIGASAGYKLVVHSELPTVRRLALDSGEATVRKLGRAIVLRHIGRKDNVLKDNASVQPRSGVAMEIEGADSNGMVLACDCQQSGSGAVFRIQLPPVDCELG